MNIYCCGCEKDTHALLVAGMHEYPHRQDLFKLPFWQCPKCGNFVGCHHKTKTPTKPLGCIATSEIKKARMEVHSILDPIWKNGKVARARLYKLISDELGYQFHTSETRSVDECKQVIKILEHLK